MAKQKRPVKIYRPLLGCWSYLDGCCNCCCSCMICCILVSNSLVSICPAIMNMLLMSINTTKKDSSISYIRQQHFPRRNQTTDHIEQAKNLHPKRPQTKETADDHQFFGQVSVQNREHGKRLCDKHIAPQIRHFSTKLLEDFGQHIAQTPPLPRHKQHVIRKTMLV